MDKDKIKKEKLKHYIDNDVFCTSMMEWKKQVKDAEKKGQPRPPVTD